MACVDLANYAFKMNLYYFLFSQCLLRTTFCIGRFLFYRTKGYLSIPSMGEMFRNWVLSVLCQFLISLGFYSKLNGKFQNYVWYWYLPRFKRHFLLKDKDKEFTFSVHEKEKYAPLNGSCIMYQVSLTFKTF